MADDHRNAHRPTDQFGEMSTDIQLALEKRLIADLKLFLRWNPALSSTGVRHVEAYHVRVSIILFPAKISQFSFQDAFPKIGDPHSLNNLIDNIWDLRRKQERRFDPLLYLGNDMMHEVLVYVVNLWGITESRAWGAEVILRDYIGDPLVLTSVSRRWSQFITSSPQLWSYLFIDTDDEDILECMQLSLLLSRNTKLLIVLYGSVTLCDAIVVDLLRVGHRIDALIYHSNVSRPTLARFRFYLGALHDQPERVCRWYKLEVKSAIQPQGYLDHYSFPTSIRSLWMGGLVPLSKLVTLSQFQSLTFLSVRVSIDPAHNYRLEFPKLEGLRVQVALASHHQVDPPVNMVCRNLKLLDLRYTLELDLEDPQEEPATWMEFDGVDALEELQVDLAIRIVTEVGSIDPLVEWLQMRLRLQDQWLLREREREQLEMAELVEERLRELQGELRWLQRLRQGLRLHPPLQEQEQEQHEQGIWQREQHLRFVMSIHTRWREWLSLPDSLEHVQRSELKVTLSTQMHKEACGVIRNTVEEVLVRRLPQLTELTTSKVLHIFPKHLRKLCFHAFAISDSWPSMTLPSLVSLEIIADSPDHLLVMRYIQVPQLRVLRVLVEDGPGTLHKHDWGDNTSNILDHISLRIEIPCDKQGDIRVLVFHLPQTHSLNVFSPYIPLHLYLAKPAPLKYTLNAGLGTMSDPSGCQVRTLSAMWNEKWLTEWIVPCGIPSIATFRTLTSLQRIVLNQRPYLLSEPSPADILFKLLEQNIHTCPQLTSITLAQCPSSWSRFLCQLHKRNREAMLSRRTKCIEELGFYQSLHATIIRWLVDAIKAKILDVIERPPIREGDVWPVRPFEAERVFRSCYICHITGMEVGCLEYETRNVDCGRERGEGSKIYAIEVVQ